MSRSRKPVLYVKDVIFVFSLLVAYFMLTSDIVSSLTGYLHEHIAVATVVSGFLFTSILTMPIASALFVVLAEGQDPRMLALLGGVGATFGDLLLIRLLRSRVFDQMPLVQASKEFMIYFKRVHYPLLQKKVADIEVIDIPVEYVEHQYADMYKMLLKKHYLLRSRVARNLVYPLLGAMIIASPLPDELGLVLLGLSDVHYWEIALLSFFMNTLGIFLLISGFQWFYVI